MTIEDEVALLAVTVNVSEPSERESFNKSTKINPCPDESITTEPISEPPKTSTLLTPDNM